MEGHTCHAKRCRQNSGCIHVIDGEAIGLCDGHEEMFHDRIPIRLEGGKQIIWKVDYTLYKDNKPSMKPMVERC